MSATKPPRLPYAPVRRGNRFWQPTPEMRKLGFAAKPLGPDGPEAWAEATRLYKAWLDARAGATKVTDYPPGTWGAYFDRLQRTKAWERKKPRTREDYHRAWKHIDPVFGRKVITATSASDCEDFFFDIEDELSPSERYRTIKVLRALFADAIVRLKLDTPNPAKTIANPQPKGRSQIWLGSEIAQLIAGAHEIGLPGMAVGIAIAWDTLFSPVDVWTLTKGAIKSDGHGRYVERARTKTDKGAFGALSEATAAALDAYVAGLGFDLLDDSPVIRMRTGQAYVHKNTWAKDFRAVRAHVFPGDQRQFLDIRRSGNLEADIAGADRETMGEILANNIASSAFLADTYTPPTVTKARQIAEKRAHGRETLKAEIDRVRTAKVV